MLCDHVEPRLNAQLAGSLRSCNEGLALELVACTGNRRVEVGVRASWHKRTFWLPAFGHFLQ
jgi:hypothetical protein